MTRNLFPVFYLNQGEGGAAGGSGNAGAGTPPPPPTHFADSFSDPGLKIHPGVRKFTSPEEMAKGYIGLEANVGKKGLVIPGEKATPKEIREAFTTLGCPPDPKSYKVNDFTPPQNLPLDDEFIAGLQEDCWEVGIAQQQYDKLFKKYVGRQEAAASRIMGDHQAAVKAATDELTKEWGSARPEKMKAVHGAINSIWGKDAETMLQTPSPSGGVLGNDPSFLRVLAQIGELTMEHGLQAGAQRRVGLTASEAQSEIDRLKGDAAFMKQWMTKSDPGHGAASAKMDTLFSQAHGAKAQESAGRGVAVGSAVA